MSPRLWQGVDWVLVALLLVQSGLGIAFIHSASGGTDLPLRQLLWLGVGLGVFFLALLVDYRQLADFSYILYALVVLVLLATLFLAAPVGGARSWLTLGPLRVQPSELAKPILCLTLAYYLSRRRGAPLRLRHLLVLAGLVGLPLGLVALQPDLGTAVVYLPLLGLPLFLYGLSWRKVAVGAVLLLLAVPVGWRYGLKPYQQERILAYLNPAGNPESAYQAVQSRIAIGSGGLTGKGYQAGSQGQLNFLPEQPTDFIFSIVAEESGFLGCCLVLGIFLLLLWKLLRIIEDAQDPLGSLLVAGFFGVFAFHVFFNIGVSLGVFPTAGIPLPLVSYGGSSLVSMYLGFGLAMNVRLRRLAH